MQRNAETIKRTRSGYRQGIPSASLCVFASDFRPFQTVSQGCAVTVNVPLAGCCMLVRPT